MNKLEQTNYCRICGLYYFQPWGEDGSSPSFEICPCCGVEFGYEDCELIIIRRYRKEWLSTGAKWWNKKRQPKDWSLEEQLKNIPEEFK